MPTAYVKKQAKKHKMSTSSAEAKWNKAKALAKKQKKGDNYAYITSIFKKLLNEEDGGIEGTVMSASFIGVVPADAKATYKTWGGKPGWRARLAGEKDTEPTLSTGGTFDSID